MRGAYPLNNFNLAKSPMSLPNNRPTRSSLRRATTKKQDAPTVRFSAISLAAVSISGAALAGAIFLWMLKNAGMSYRNGYLLAFGLQPDAMPWSSDDLAYLGYYAQEDLLVDLLGLFVGLMLLIAAVLYAGNWMNYHMSKRRERKGIRTTLKKSENFVTQEIIFFCMTAIVFFSLMYFSVLPMALFNPACSRGEKVAQTEMRAIREWRIDELKKHKLNFVEITRDKADPVTGVIISCTEKFCGIYSSGGPVHTHTVPLTDIKTWSKIEWENVPTSAHIDSSHTGPGTHVAGSLEVRPASVPR